METIIKNRKAYYDYEIMGEYLCGIQLLGYEVKPIKNGRTSINDSYCVIDKGEIFITNMHINITDNPTINVSTLNPYRVRKLLLKRVEIDKLTSKTEQKGLTLIPLELKKTKSGIIKVKIGLCKGRKNYSKKNLIKERDIDREINKQIIEK